MKIILIVLTLLCLTIPAMAEDVKLAWEQAERADGYILYMTTDNGATWQYEDVGAVTEYVWVGVPEDKEVRFKIGAYNYGGTAINEYATVNFDARKKPPLPPMGLGVK